MKEMPVLSKYVPLSLPSMLSPLPNPQEQKPCGSPCRKLLSSKFPTGPPLLRSAFCLGAGQFDLYGIFRVWGRPTFGNKQGQGWGLGLAGRRGLSRHCRRVFVCSMRPLLLVVIVRCKGLWAFRQQQQQQRQQLKTTAASSGRHIEGLSLAMSAGRDNGYHQPPVGYCWLASSRSGSAEAHFI